MSGITTCSACAFYFSRGEQEGACRRYPPSSGNTGFQPPVRPTGGCGEGELKAELRCQKCGKPLPGAGAPCEICGPPVAETNALREQIFQTVEERADLLRRLDVARHAHEDLKMAMNRTIQDCRDQNAVQCQEIVSKNLQLDRMEKDYRNMVAEKNQEIYKVLRERDECGAQNKILRDELGRQYEKIAVVQGERDGWVKAHTETLTKLNRREQEYQDLARMHRADCDKGLGQAYQAWHDECAKEHPLFGKLRESTP